MVNKITTPPTQNEVIDKINELVDGKQDTITSSNKLSASLVSGLSTVATSGSYNDLSNKPTVDQTYSATSTNAQSGVAVASAIGNGSVTINQGGTPRGTFTMNQSSNLTIDLDGTSGVSAIAILNKNTASPYQTLGIWQGTESQWNNGELKTWYNWKTNPTMISQTANLPNNKSAAAIAYGNGYFVSAKTNENVVIYSNDNGSTWQTGSGFSSSGANQIIYDDVNEAFIAYNTTARNVCISFNNGLNWTSRDVSASAWYSDSGACGNGYFVISNGSKVYRFVNNLSSVEEKSLPSYNGYGHMAFGNNCFLLAGSYGKLSYSTDNGATWGERSIASYIKSIIYANNKFRMIKAAVFYSSDDNGETWSSSDIPNGDWVKPAYGNGTFVTLSVSSNRCIYSTDDGVTWTEVTLPVSAYWRGVRYENGVFLAAGDSYIIYSLDNGATWTNSEITSDTWFCLSSGNNKFVVCTSNTSSNISATISFSSDSCYTDTANPTTTSTVYSAPDTASSYTISSVTSGAITLSNNNTYYYNQSGNAQTYDTIGNTHPEYLCFIDGVGVKIGNTTIATNNSNNS